MPAFLSIRIDVFNWNAYRQYSDQEFERKHWYEKAGHEYMHSKDAVMRAMVAEKKARKLEEEKEAKAKQRRIDSQLKGLTGAEREQVQNTFFHIYCIILLTICSYGVGSSCNS